MTLIMQDKVAIITGGAGGIGSRIAREFARCGAHVVIASRTRERIEQVAEEVRGLGREALAITTDVTDPAQVARMVDQTVERFGSIDIMVNNAGGAMFIKAPEELLPEEWNAAIALNLTSVFLCSAAAGKVMMKQSGGRIINISSVAGIRYSPQFVHYGAAKAAVINLTKSLAVSWARHSINVNCIAPGLTATEGVADWLPPRHRKDGTPVPALEYPPDPQHVAELAAFLASPASAHISGELFPIRSLKELS
jgi:3-oxoacyl-[acyl-carrier protein] reductase